MIKLQITVISVLLLDSFLVGIDEATAMLEKTEQQDAEGLSPTVLKELSSAPHCMSEHSDEAAALVNILRAALTDTLTQKTQLSHVRTPTHRNCEKITADCFKPLNLVVICSKAVNKECLWHPCHVFRDKDPAPL